MRERTLGIGGVTMATQIHEDQSMALGELGGEGMPVLRTTAESMQEHEGLSDSVLLVEHLDVVDRDRMPPGGRLRGSVLRRHWSSPRMRGKVNRVQVVMR